MHESLGFRETGDGIERVETEDRKGEEQPSG